MIELQDEILLYLVKTKMFEKIVGETPSNVMLLPLKNENDSISGRVSFHQQSIFKLAIEFENKPNMICILKLKSEQIIRNGMNLINYDRSTEFQKILEGPHNIIGYDNSHIRECRFYDNVVESLKDTLPRILGSFYDPENDIYAILMEEYENKRSFDEYMIVKSLDAITDFHACYYNRYESVHQLLLNHYTTADYKAQKPILVGMMRRLEEDNRTIFSNHHRELLLDFVMHIDEYHKNLPVHQTLTHNDFTPRNIFCQENGVIIFDWELSCYQCPEHDLIEFILFIMYELTDEQILSIIDTFKNFLFKKCNICFNDEIYNQILTFNLLEYCVNRLSLYRICNKGLNIGFIDVLATNAERLLTIMNI